MFFLLCETERLRLRERERKKRERGKECDIGKDYGKERDKKN